MSDKDKDKDKPGPYPRPGGSWKAAEGLAVDLKGGGNTRPLVI